MTKPDIDERFRNITPARFNELYSSFRLREIDPVTRSDEGHTRRFQLDQWCSVQKDWCKMLLPGRWWIMFRSEDSTPVPDEDCIINERWIEQIQKRQAHIIVCKEKHGTEYFPAVSTEDIGMAALYVLKQRYEQGFYYKPGAPPMEPITKPEELADPELKKKCEEQWESYRRESRTHQEDAHFYNCVEKALDSGDYALATEVLLHHADYEYEGFQFETLTNVYNRDTAGHRYVFFKE